MRRMREENGWRRRRLRAESMAWERRSPHASGWEWKMLFTVNDSRDTNTASARAAKRVDLGLCRTSSSRRRLVAAERFWVLFLPAAASAVDGGGCDQLRRPRRETENLQLRTGSHDDVVRPRRGAYLIREGLRGRRATNRGVEDGA